LVRIGPFGWHTIPLRDGDGLAALRQVVTPDGPRVQGFLVSDSEIASALAGSPFPARFLPGPANREGETGVPLDETVWHVAVDGGSTLASAAVRGQAIRGRFRREFGWGMLGALVALAAVMAVVLQSERLARDRSRLAATAAHELRTPLASLRMYGEMLAEDLGDPNKSKEYARRISGESERLGRVVSNLLGLARLERRNLSVQPEPGDLAEAVRACVERQRPVLEAAGLRVETELAAGLPSVSFDRDAVSQILQNLLDNAEKYTRGCNERVVTVTVEDGATSVTISVADNGPGIPASVRSRLFHPFAAAHREGAEGLGLGLALTRALARAHGGDVIAGEAPGGGTIVRVTLPA
ncbi:MAG TPA: HAMP domain-containing sensor histidine kinase, partial [Thermoanaerobaculia bacterium]|nr:HAMP domain-containing sensor histidine kinase [Thermoanaerobaculia bacterium]